MPAKTHRPDDDREHTRPDERPNPFKIGEHVRLRDGTFTNGTVTRVLAGAVLVAWNDVPGEPQWYNHDLVLYDRVSGHEAQSTARRDRESGAAVAGEVSDRENQEDVVDHLLLQVERLDAGQLERFDRDYMKRYRPLAKNSLFKA